MKSTKLLLTLIFITIIQIAEAQIVLPSRIVKVGFSSDFMPFQSEGHYSIHFDLENSTRNFFVTNEFGAGFMHNNTDLFYLKFDYKFYPLSAILHNFRYQMLYLSVGPGIYYEGIDSQADGFGLGLFTTGGVQVLFKNRFSLALEMEVNMLSNLNAGSENYNSSAPQVVYFTNSIKIGYLFNKK